MKRRTYLATVGSVFTSAGLAGCFSIGEGTETPPPTSRQTGTATTPRETTAELSTSTDGPATASERQYPYEDRFDTVVDVERRGGDPTGQEPVNDILEQELADDTLFFFPEGEYRIEDLLIVQHHRNVGFVGPDATLYPADGHIGDWIIVIDVGDFLFEGLELDNSAGNTGARTKLHVSSGANVVRDVAITGFHDVSNRTHGFTLQVNGPETSLLLDRVEMTDGAQNGTAVFVHPSNEPGTIRFQDCHIENWYEQGLYGSSHGGPMYVVGGHYGNNGLAQVRTGGGNADTPAVVRDVTVRIDDPYPADAKEQVFGIWLHEGEGTVVENCDITITELSEAGSSGALVLGPEQGRTTIRNTDIRVDGQTFALTATSPKEDNWVIPSMEQPPRNWDIIVENTTIAGEADNTVGILIVDRPGCTIRDVEIEQTGERRDGIGLLRSPGATIDGISCSTPRYPLITSADRQSDGCLVSLARISTFESRDYNIASPDARVQPNGEQQYCVDRTAFDVTDEMSMIGATDYEDEAILASVLSESVINYY